MQNTKNTLNRISWRFDSDNKCILELCGTGISYFSREMLDKLLEYKKLYWKDGIIHLDDVLFFAYTLLINKPNLIDFLVARYPYILVDEFQDTSPLQAAILTLLGEKGSIIGVVGDPAQSIFSFNGAERTKLIEFDLEGQVYYIMKKNRSTQKIISLLNHIRRDDVINLTQCPLDPENTGNNVKILVYSDDLQNGIENYLSTVGDLSYCILARKNLVVNNIKGLNENILQKLVNRSNRSRASFFELIFNSIEYANDANYGNAIKELLRVLKTDSEGKLKRPFKNGSLKNRVKKQIVSSNMLFFIIKYIKQNEDANIYQFYTAFADYLKNTFSIELQNYRASGDLYDFITSIDIDSVIKSQNTDNKKESIRTIHKSKGSEFNSILVVLETENELERFIINPESRICGSADDCRIFYVALSRAENELCIAVPSLNVDKISTLTTLNIDVDENLSVNYKKPKTLSYFFG